MYRPNSPDRKRQSARVDARVEQPLRQPIRRAAATATSWTRSQALSSNRWIAHACCISCSSGDSRLGRVNSNQHAASHRPVRGCALCAYDVGRYGRCRRRATLLARLRWMARDAERPCRSPSSDRAMRSDRWRTTAQRVPRGSARRDASRRLRDDRAAGSEARATSIRRASTSCVCRISTAITSAACRSSSWTSSTRAGARGRSRSTGRRAPKRACRRSSARSTSARRQTVAAVPGATSSSCRRPARPPSQCVTLEAFAVPHVSELVVLRLPRSASAGVDRLLRRHRLDRRAPRRARKAPTSSSASARRSRRGSTSTSRIRDRGARVRRSAASVSSLSHLGAGAAPRGATRSRLEIAEDGMVIALERRSRRA